MRFLIDSDWIIDAMKGIPGALSLLQELSPDGLGVSMVVLGELFEGVQGVSGSASDLISVQRFLAGYQVLNLSEAIMATFAHHRALLRRQGRLIPDLDLLIAATALTHDLTLVTRNQRHFARIPGLRLYLSR